MKDWKAVENQVSGNVGKPALWILSRSDTNQALHLLEMAGGLKFCIKEEEVLCYPSSENKGADQLRDIAKLICAFVFTYAKRWFSHDAAQVINM